MGTNEYGKQRLRVPAQRPGEVRVAVVADQKLTGQTVSEALGSLGFRVFRHDVPHQASGVRELKERFARQQIDVALLLNERSDWVSISEAIRAVREVPDVTWMLLSADEDHARWGAAMEAGARGAGTIFVGVAEVAGTLHQLAAGLEIVGAEERDRMLAAWDGQRQVSDRLGRLTQRERQVLQHLRQGHGVVEIAADFYVSVGTVRSQVSAVLAKLEVQSQIAAVALLERVSLSA